MLLCMSTANEYVFLDLHLETDRFDRLLCKHNVDMWTLFYVCTVIVYMVMVMLNQCGTLSLNVANYLYGKTYVLNRLFYSLQIVL